MSAPNFTDKASEVLQAALNKAQEMGNSTTHPLHIISVLWDDPSPQASSSTSTPTLLYAALESCHGDPKLFNRALLSRLNKLPQVDPPPQEHPPLTQSFTRVIMEAQKLQKEGGDEYIAVDHLILALLRVDHAELKELLKVANVEPGALEAEIKRKRGGRKADSKSAESQFDALNKCELRSTSFPRFVFLTSGVTFPSSIVETITDRQTAQI